MRMTDIQKKNVKKICRIVAVLLAIGAFAIVLNSITLEVNIKDVFWEWILFTGVYGFSYYLFHKREEFVKRKTLVRQFFIPSLFAALFWNLAYFSQGTDKSNYIAFYGFAALNLLLILLTYLLISDRQITYLVFVEKIRDYCRGNKFLIATCILFVIGSVPILTTWLNQDGIDYYTCISELKTWNFTDLRALQMAGHHTEVYTMMLMIGEFLLPGHGVGVRLVCIVLAVLTIIAFDAILKILFHNEHSVERVILTGIFAFSPYLFGMLAEINTDFPLLCFFVWTVLFHLKKEYVMQAFCGALLCFTKEPGCLIYGAYVLGIVVCIIYENRKNVSEMLDKLTARRMLVNYGPGVLWIFYFIGIQFRVWGTTTETSVSATETGYKLNSFDIWGTYIVYRLKEIFLFNYAWIFWGVIFLGLLWIALHYKKFVWKNGAITYIPICFSLGALLFINTVYITYPHIRYNIPFLFIETLCFGIIVTSVIKRSIVRKLFLSGVLVITILSNYMTDPISEKIFYCIDSGNGQIVCPRLFYSPDGYCYEFEEISINYSQLNEGSAYNRQYLGRGKCFEQLFDQIDYRESDLIVVPNIAKDKDMLYRHVLLRKTAWTEGSMYWNTEKKMTNANFFFDETLYDSAEWDKINTVVLEEGEPLREEWFSEYERVFYLKLPINKEYDHEQILKDYSIERYIAQNNVWKLEMLELNGKRSS